MTSNPPVLPEASTPGLLLGGVRRSGGGSTHFGAVAASSHRSEAEKFFKFWGGLKMI